MKKFFLIAILSLSSLVNGQSLGLEPETVLSMLVTQRYVIDGEVVLDKQSRNTTAIESDLISFIIDNGSLYKFKNRTRHEGIRVIENIRCYSITIGDKDVKLYVTDTEDPSGEYKFWQTVTIVILRE